MLSQSLGIPALNLGYGGSGPEFFARQPELINYANRGAFAIVQIMSGRSQSNSLYGCDGLEYMHRKSDGSPIGAKDSYVEMIAGPRALAAIPPASFGPRLARVVGRARTRKIVEETRSGWLENYRALLDAIKVPTVVFWYRKDRRTTPSRIARLPISLANTLSW